MYPQFENRREAGQELSSALAKYKAKKDTLILALPRGGVPVAHEVAKILDLPMDVWLVRKLATPGNEELAIGAIAFNGTCYINKDITLELNIPQRLIDQIIAKERIELDRRNKLYRQERPLPSLRGKTIIIVDDGLATGATMRAAIESLRHIKTGRIVAAVPVGAEDACRALKEIADEVICLRAAEPFYGVGQWYRDFSQTSDEEVQRLLTQTMEHTT